MSIQETMLALNTSNLRESSMGDEEFMRDMAKIFLQQSLEKISLLESHCLDGETGEWVEAAHALKGMSSTLGADRLKLFCSEAQLMRNSTAQLRTEMVHIIKYEREQVIKALRHEGLI